MVDAGHSNLFQRHPILPFIFGASFVQCGIGSWIYHASMTKFGLFLDYATIMVAVPFISLYVMLDLWEGDFDEKLIDKYTLPVYALLFLFSYFFTYIFGSYYTAVTGPIFAMLIIYGT